MEYKTRYFSSLASTQDKAKEFSRQGLNNIIVIAGKQTKGKGRFKRKWYSSEGGLWMSILLKPDNTGNIQYLTFAAAVSVVNAVNKITKLKTRIKWPNDVHYKGRKLCGILTEGIFEDENYVVVGIGLNVNHVKFPAPIKNTATSLKILKTKKYCIKNLLKLIIKEFFLLYNYYNENKLDKIMELWKKHCDTINKNVTVTTKTKKIYGKAIGVDKDCNLLLKLKNNTVKKIIEGDIKVRY